MDEKHEDRRVPDWACALRYACPRCRSPLGGDVQPFPRCPACGFAAKQLGGVVSFLPNLEMMGDWQAQFDAKAATTEGDTTAALDYRTPIQQQYLIDGLRRIFGRVPADAQILDVGCGNGTFWDALGRHERTVGIDYSLGMCRRALRRALYVHQADALALPFAADQFDFVYCFELLQYLTNPAPLLAELGRVCVPGGRIAVSTLNRTSVLRWAARLLRRVRPVAGGQPKLPMSMWSVDEIESAARNLPLSLDRVCWTHFPLPWQRCTKLRRNLLEPLASNIILSFVKRPNSSFA
jgi:SAM-dependent methyltransferase